MRKHFLYLILFLPLFGISQTKNIDSTAVYILDHMTHVIGELGSVSFNLKTSTDHNHFEHGVIKKFASHDVSMVGPDKMLVQSLAEDDHKGYWYNGEHFAYYSYDENNYSIIDAPDNILATIDSINTHYDVEFPAGDFFYPAFTDDLVDAFDSVEYLGSKKVNGRECFHILATGSEINLQLWISNDAYTLPEKFAITYKKRAGNPQYEATFSNWVINPEFPDSLFDFIPPPEAREIYFVAKTELD